MWLCWCLHQDLDQLSFASDNLLLTILCFAVFVSMQALFNQFGQGKALYAVLPVSPKAAQRGKLDAATLTQHELGSPGVDDSANERSDSGDFV